MKGTKNKSKDSSKAIARDLARRRLIEMKRAAAKQVSSQANDDREVEIFVV